MFIAVPLYDTIASICAVQAHACRQFLTIGVYNLTYSQSVDAGQATSSLGRPERNKSSEMPDAAKARAWEVAVNQ
jgi:hypothetical protein